ncbi:probable 39S ribosomal protein L49, mitochondrial [Contarinia nasturtii]|uniref:probable 39S ribosomal protein L49, mitochondrial n=1 Tax=Contarinia nasturtii TaxID=265458 RepID=UPI0012D3EECB|nr:probable 39S ribosomal protein L49, mitochondrial [Contarinia nasturtii]
MAFLVRNTHRTFSAIFKKTLASSTTQFSAYNGIDLTARTLHISHNRLGENPRLTATEDVDLNAQPLIEVLKNPPEWKYVEQILPKLTVPSVTPKAEYPSGWVPQHPDGHSHPYFVRRNRNHMVPVYLSIDRRGTWRKTYVKFISGDIWKLHKDLMDYIEYYMCKKERSRVNEFTRQIIINGDYVNLIKDYLIQKGF